MSNSTPLTKENLDYLLTLDQKLGKLETYQDPKRGTIRHRNYTEYQLTSEELQNALDITQNSSDCLLFPCNTNWGFSVGYGILHVTTPPTLFPGADQPEEYKTLLQIKDKQLPQNHTWDNIASIFNSKDNLDKIATLLRNPPQTLDGYHPSTGFKDRGHYEY